MQRNRKVCRLRFSFTFFYFCLFRYTSGGGVWTVPQQPIGGTFSASFTFASDVCGNYVVPSGTISLVFQLTGYVKIFFFSSSFVLSKFTFCRYQASPQDNVWQGELQYFLNRDTNTFGLTNAFVIMMEFSGNASSLMIFEPRS